MRLYCGMLTKLRGQVLGDSTVHACARAQHSAAPRPEKPFSAFEWRRRSVQLPLMAGNEAAQLAPCLSSIARGIHIDLRTRRAWKIDGAFL